jgi:hypothetical protein
VQSGQNIDRKYFLWQMYTIRKPEALICRGLGARIQGRKFYSKKILKDHSENFKNVLEVLN